MPAACDDALGVVDEAWSVPPCRRPRCVADVAVVLVQEVGRGRCQVVVRQRDVVGKAPRQKQFGEPGFEAERMDDIHARDAQSSGGRYQIGDLCGQIEGDAGVAEVGVPAKDQPAFPDPDPVDHVGGTADQPGHGLGIAKGATARVVEDEEQCRAGAVDRAGPCLQAPMRLDRSPADEVSSRTLRSRVAGVGA